MNYLDLTPLYRSTVGFDRLVSLLGEMNPNSRQSGYPPCNIERTGDHAYRISVAVAGFSEDDVRVSLERNELLIGGAIEREGQDSGAQYLYQGIAARSFQRRFRLNDHVRVADAWLEHGMLHVDLVQEIPEEMKRRRIPVRSGSAGKKPDAIETQSEAEAA